MTDGERVGDLHCFDVRLVRSIGPTGQLDTPCVVTVQGGPQSGQEGELQHHDRARVHGHLYWAAQNQGLTFDEAETLAVQVNNEYERRHLGRVVGSARIAAFNDSDGRSAHEVAECLRQVATRE